MVGGGESEGERARLDLEARREDSRAAISRRRWVLERSRGMRACEEERGTKDGDVRNEREVRMGEQREEEREEEQ